MSASSTVASLIPELIIIFFGGVKNDIMLELLELANMIKSFSCSRCSAKSFIKKNCNAHAQSVMDCAEIKSDTPYIYSMKIVFPNWSNGNDLQTESGWSWTWMATFHSAPVGFLTLSFHKNAWLKLWDDSKEQLTWFNQKSSSSAMPWFLFPMPHMDISLLYLTYNV